MKLTWDLIEEASENANHCQRNWDRKKAISDETVDKLIKIATNMPTKQNRAFYHLLVSKNQSINKEIYKRAIDIHNIEGTEKRNSQVDGHLTFLYVKNNFHEVDQELIGNEKIGKTPELLIRHDFHANMSMGISAGAVALAANQMGLRTGFCCCYDRGMLEDYLKSIGHEVRGCIVTILGIGYPNTEYDSNVVIKDAENKEDEKVLFRVTQHKKSIKHKLL